jgi:6-phosphogluconolactonase (cycloisomerase 2 family)
VAADPTGRFLYVPNMVSNDIWAFSIDHETGMLTPIAGSPYPTGMAPHAVELDPSGRFVYVANSGSNSVSVYCLDRVSGGLMPLATVPTPGSAFSIAIGGGGS